MFRSMSLGALLMAIGAAGCGAAPVTASGGARDVRLTSAQGSADTPLTEAELQQSLQRVAGQFIDSMTQALGELGRAAPSRESDAALRANALYASSALDIATGPLPEVNLLDMLVFVRLSREVFETHWMPELYGERGRAALDVFRTAEDDLWRIASRVLSPEQRATLEELIEDWRRDNPDQFRVEGVRLLDFAQRAGRVETDRAKAASGILSSVKSATQVADQALLIAERGMFLAHRMPFLLRIHARIVSRDIVSDAVAKLGSPAQLMAQMQAFEPMARELPALAERAGEAAHEGRLLVQDVRPLVPSAETVERIDGMITKANDLTTSTRDMLKEVRALTPSDPNTTAAATTHAVDAVLTRGLVYLAALGAIWSALFWGGYYVVKRRLGLRRSPESA